jgi:hypothetical protein
VRGASTEAMVVIDALNFVGMSSLQLVCLRNSGFIRELNDQSRLVAMTDDCFSLVEKECLMFGDLCGDATSMT